MTQPLAFIVLIVAVGICEISYARVMDRPRWIQCQSNSECTPGYCCTIGKQKFSIPQCKLMRDIGDVCRPDGSITLNTTLMYPDGSQIELTEVHDMFCPCGYGLSCDRRDAVCRDPSQERGFNHLPGEGITEDD
nr:astakine-like [Neodiprion pinetum]XP_046481484.1 astakine-like [Neodiprion pinetum]